MAQRPLGRYLRTGKRGGQRYRLGASSWQAWIYNGGSWISASPAGNAKRRRKRCDGPGGGAIERTSARFRYVQKRRRLADLKPKMQKIAELSATQNRHQLG
jgi:hypothetical protein